MKMRLLTCFALACALVFASTEPTPLKVDRVVALALENSPLLSGDKARVESEKLLREHSGLLPNPSVVLDGGKISSGATSGPILEGTLYQTVPFPGKRAAKEQAHDAQVRSSENLLASNRVRVQHEAVVLSYRLAALNRLVKHIEERKSRFALVRAYLASRPFASPVQEVEKDLIEHKLRLLEEHLIQRESDYHSAGFELNSLIAQPSPILPEVVWWKSPKPINIDEYRREAREKNPETLRYRFNLEKAEAEYRQGRLAFWPDFNLGFGFRQEGNTSPTHFYTGYLTLNLPLWDRGQYLADGMGQAKEAERWKLEHQTRAAEKDLQQAIEGVEKSRKALLLFPLDRIPKAKKGFDRAEAEFRRGRLPISAFLEIESQSHEMQDRVFEVQIEYAQSLSRLLLLVARNMPLEPQ